MTELTQEAVNVIEKVKKLLALAGNNPNENEAQSATSKAMALLEAYNLDMAIIGNTAKGSQRNDKKLKGGLYGWQRDLWKAVSELNFCMYWSIKGLTRGSTYEHRILGSHANVVSAEVLAGYLQYTVERLAQEWAKPRYNSVFVREAIAYREGMAARLVERLNALRSERIKADQATKEEAWAHGATGTQALVLADVVHSEDDYNSDYVHGYEPGYHAQQRAERNARQAAAQAAAAEILAQRKKWEEENPEEAAAQRAMNEAEQEAYWKQLHDKWAKDDEKRAKARERRTGSREAQPQYRQATPQEKRARLHSFAEGKAKANDVGLDKQIDRNQQKQVR